MNKEQEYVSDELMTRWLCGKATPEEEPEVLAYFEENDERIDDLLTVSAASKLCDEERVDKRKTITGRWQIWTAAASVALIIGTCLVFLSGGEQLQVDNAPVYGVEDSLDVNDTVYLCD